MLAERRCVSDLGNVFYGQREHDAASTGRQGAFDMAEHPGGRANAMDSCSTGPQGNQARGAVPE